MAGNGVEGFGGDNGPATNASLGGTNGGPRGVAFDSAGNLFMSDPSNNRVQRVDAVTHVITTFVGNGTKSFSGDGGPATDASLSTPFGVALDKVGNLFIAIQTTLASAESMRLRT